MRAAMRSFGTRARRGWRAAAAAAGALLLAAGVALPAPLQAAPRTHQKIARDLQQALRAERPGAERWVREVRGSRHVQLVLVTDSPDPALSDLRAAVLALGGSVHAHHAAFHALTVQVPARAVEALVQRADVVSASPNRSVRRTSSTLEAVSGALTPNVRSYGMLGYSGLDGSGVGVAVLDSGVMREHRQFDDALGLSRVAKNVNLRNAQLADWLVGVDSTISPAPYSTALAAYESQIDVTTGTSTHDPYGHGTHVASVLAGRGAYQNPDASGIAPGARLYDVRVLDTEGRGSLSDTLEGIQWVIFHAREYNIRVLNVSLAAASTESWQTDPLCIAVRRATAAGITVVVAAGNFGKGGNGAETYGTISAPGNDPSVITVGAVNHKGSHARSDDNVNHFSSRGPTRGGRLVDGVRVVDNLLKPDLVAPGNAIVGAAATRASVLNPAWNKLATNYPALVAAANAPQYYEQTLMVMSGTSIAAPAVAGAAALMLQANPGLTPPLVKAILQYSAQPLAGQNLLQQGAGLLNVDGAVTIARQLRTDIGPAIEAGTLAPGASLLATGKAMPVVQQSTLSGQAAKWSRLVFVGGNRLFSGSALLTRHHPIWDPRLVWAGGTVLRTQPLYWSGLGYPSNVFVRGFSETRPSAQTLLAAGTVDATTLAGSSSMAGRTGAFMPVDTLSSWLASGSGVVLTQGIVLSEGVVLSEGLVLSEGADAAILGER